MSQAKCPSCGFGFDNHRRSGSLRGLRGRLLYGPERLIRKLDWTAPHSTPAPNCGRDKFPQREFTSSASCQAKIQSMGAIYAVMAFSSLRRVCRYGLRASKNSLIRSAE